MSEPEHPPILKPNPITRRRHRQEVLWQISVPLGVGVLLVLLAAAGVIFAGATGRAAVERWASISTIWLILPMLMVALLFIAITAAFAYGVMRLIAVLPGYSRKVQDFFILVETRVKKAADAAVEPSLRVQSMLAGLRAVRRK
jgi:hypothetical protein